MVANTPTIFLLFACTILISSAYKLSPPTNYTWPQNTKNLCFAARFDLVLNVEYLREDGTKNTVKVPLNNNTYESYTVSCTAPTNVHQLTISMLDSLTAIIFQFTFDDKNMTSLTTVSGYITMNDKQTSFPNYANITEGVHHFSSNESLFTNERASSYRCNTKTSIKSFNTDKNVTITSVDIENLRIQPFVDDAQEFSDYAVEKVCSADIDKNSNLIPIIVGACLAVLVIIVLLAYLIGRRRSRNGYQSV
jgi:lysosomal-associated membrane protein 1/2